MQSVPVNEPFITANELFIPDHPARHSPLFTPGNRSARSIFEINTMAKGDVPGAGPSRPRFTSGGDSGVPDEGLARRRFLRAAALSVAGLVSGFDRLLSMPPVDTIPGGKLIGLVSFEDEKVAPPGTLIGTE